MAKLFWETDNWFDKKGSESLISELNWRSKIIARFRTKRETLDPALLERYTVDKVDKAIKAVNRRNQATFISLAHQLGFSKNITVEYHIKGEQKPKSLLDMAKDYCSLLNHAEFRLDKLIDVSVSINIQCKPTFKGYGEGAQAPVPRPLPASKQTSREVVYKYFEHLSQ